MKQIYLISFRLDGVTAGPAVRFQRYAPFFMEKGYRLTFLTYYSNPDLPEKESRQYFDVIRIASTAKFLRHTLFISKAIWKVCIQKKLPEALLTFSCNTFQLWLLPLLKLRGIKLIYISTMDFDMQYRTGGGFFNAVYNNIHQWLYRLLYLNMHAIVTSTKKLAERFLPFHLPAGKVAVIFNGVDTARFFPADTATKKEMRKKNGLPETGRIVLFVGLKTERKGILDLYDAWKIYHAQHPADHLVLVGDEKPETNPAAFNQKWEAIKNEVNVTGMGIIIRGNDKNVETYFQAADLFVFLSHIEGMPNVLLEAMACGLPVVLTRFQGFSEDYGVPGEHVVVVERNPDEIAAEMERILYNPQRSAMLGGNALQKIKENGSITQSVGAYIDLTQKR